MNASEIRIMETPKGVEVVFDGDPATFDESFWEALDEVWETFKANRLTESEDPEEYFGRYDQPTV